MRDALILADSSPEDHSLFGVFRCFLQGDVAKSKGLAGKEAPLGVHPVENL
jgi:hypothetical protein